jgi:hypothetical protein
MRSVAMMGLPFGRTSPGWDGWTRAGAFPGVGVAQA